MVGCYLPFKKTLKALVGKPLTEARLIETSFFEPEIKQTGRFSVVGPDPYHHRNWFASITTREGVITKVE